MRREYLTLDQAADMLGWHGKFRGQRLFRALRARETRLGREIMVRRGGHKQPRYRLTEGLLRRYCRELFLTSQDELVGEVRRHLSALESQIEAVVDDRTAPQFEELRANHAKLAGETVRLAAHTKRIASRVDSLEAFQKRVEASAKGVNG